MIGLASGSAMRIGSPDVRHVLLHRVDVEGLADRGHQVGHRSLLVGDFRPVGAGFAVELAALDSAAGKNRRPCGGEVVAAVVAVDFRRAAEFAHPDDENVVAHSAVFQVGEQRRPAGIKDFAQLLHGIEVVGVRVPGEGLVSGDTVERHFNKRDAVFHKPAGQQAALAELISTVAVAQLRRFSVERKRFDGFGPHHPDRLIVGGTVAAGGNSRARVEEVVFQIAQQVQAGIGLFAIDTRRTFEVADLQRAFVVVATGLSDGNTGGTSHDQRRVLRAEEPRSVSRRTQEAVRADADVVRKFRSFLPEFLRDHRSHRGVMNRPLRKVTGAHQESRPRVVAFLGAHRTHGDDRLRLPREFRQVLGDFESGHRGLDGFEFSAIGVAGFHVESVGLWWTARHPEQDAGPFLAFWVFRSFFRQRRQPPGHGSAERAQGREPQPFATIQISHESLLGSVMNR